MPSIERKVFHESDAVNEKLQSMELELEWLTEALTAAAMKTLMLSDLVPEIFPGMDLWAKVTESFRLKLGPRGWDYNPKNNATYFFSPSNQLCFTTFSGSTSTGTGSGRATNKSSKGHHVQKACLINSPSSDLFGMEPDVHQLRESGSIPTWVLLYHLDLSDTTNIVLRSELSKPEAYYKKQIIAWSEQIIFPEISMNNANISLDNDYELSEEVDIDILRKN